MKPHILHTLILFILSVVSLGQDYSCSHKALSNPEKGPLGWCSLTADRDYSSYTSDGTYQFTLCYASIELNNFLNSTIDEATIELIGSNLDELRTAGTKAIVRIMYATDLGEDDTTLNWVEAHLQQLEPIFQSNVDVIAWFQAGIIGAWGEWHGSSSGLDTDENKVAVWNLLHTYLPTEPCMKVQVRYPMIMQELVPVLLMNDEEAFGHQQCTEAHRLGFHNDCWMSNWHDTGTYQHNGVWDAAARNYWLPYAHNVTRYGPYGGETCLDGSTDAVWDQLTCSFMFEEADLLHASFLNPTWHPDVTQYLKDNCCWEEFIDRLGYRFEVDIVTLPTVIFPGRELSYKFEVRNTGWGSVYSMRKVYLVLEQVLTHGDMHTISIDGNFEEWEMVTDGFDDNYDDSSNAVADVKSVQIANDEDNIYVLISFHEVAAGYVPFATGHFRLFFDTDQSQSTGYRVGPSDGKIGSEVMIHGQHVFDQRSGGWNDGQLSESVQTSVSSDNLVVEIAISRNWQFNDGTSVFSANGFRLMVNVADSSWGFAEIAPDTAYGYQYSFHNTADDVLLTQYDLGSDVRTWSPEAGVVIVEGFVLAPEELISGGDNASLSLWLPDPSPSLEYNERTAIQLRRGGTWDAARGMNVLSRQIEVREIARIPSYTSIVTSKKPYKKRDTVIAVYFIGATCLDVYFHDNTCVVRNEDYLRLSYKFRIPYINKAAKIGSEYTGCVGDADSQWPTVANPMRILSGRFKLYTDVDSTRSFGVDENYEYGMNISTCPHDGGVVPMTHSDKYSFMSTAHRTKKKVKLRMINIPDASCISIYFDEKTNLLHNRDYVTIYKDGTQRDYHGMKRYTGPFQKSSYPTKDSPLQIHSSQFMMKFYSGISHTPRKEHYFFKAYVSLCSE